MYVPGVVLPAQLPPALKYTPVFSLKLLRGSTSERARVSLFSSPDILALQCYSEILKNIKFSIHVEPR